MTTAIKFRQHIPSFVDVREPVPVEEFDGLQSLLGNLKKAFGEHVFSHWARDGNAILGVWDDGLHWWVMGFTDGDISALPVWRPHYLALIDGVETRLTGEQVKSSCGAWLTLQDGSVVLNASK